MGNADWCAWCLKVMKGGKSFYYGLCYDCRHSKEGKEYVRKVGERDDIII